MQRARAAFWYDIHREILETGGKISKRCTMAGWSEMYRCIILADTPLSRTPVGM